MSQVPPKPLPKYPPSWNHADPSYGLDDPSGGYSEIKWIAQGKRCKYCTRLSLISHGNCEGCGALIMNSRRSSNGRAAPL